MKLRPSIFLVLVMVFISWKAVELNSFLPKSQNSFQRGESLTYKIHYGIITAGRATLSISPEINKQESKDCFHIIGEGKSAKAFDWFFKVRDRYETFIDTTTYLPVKFKRDISEGNFKMYREIIFNHEEGFAQEWENNSEKPSVRKISDDVQDVLSAFYFARRQDFSMVEKGYRAHYKNFIDHKTHDLTVEYLGRELLEVDGHYYKTVKLKPLVEEGGVFQHKGDMWIWISDDKNRIPIRIESGLIIGAIQIDLEDHQNLLHPFSSKIQ